MSDEVAVESLENRLRLLERSIFAERASVPSENVSSSIGGISTMLDTALESREKLDGLIKLLPFLEDIADENSNGKDTKDGGKEAAVLGCHEDVKAFLDECSNIADLKSNLESEEIKKIALAKVAIDFSTSTYKQLLSDYTSMRQKAEKLFITYNVMINELSKILIAMDADIRVHEEKAAAKVYE